MTTEHQFETSTLMQNWKLILSYDGTEFHGWQVQPNCRTVQGELQGALGRVTGEAPLPQGSGRTDAGVHALGQVASFTLAAAIPPGNLKRALNRTLPAAIRVLDAEPAADDFHARHSARAKTYEYRVFLEKPEPGAGPNGVGGVLCPPFITRYVYAYPWPLDRAALREAAQHFVGSHNFLSFAATDPDETARAKGSDEDDLPTPVRTIFDSAWSETEIEEGAMLVYRVRGSGFLHHMVRNLVGTMLDVGRGYRRASEIPEIIAARARVAAGPTAPARGLFLHSVEYSRETDAGSALLT